MSNSERFLEIANAQKTKLPPVSRVQWSVLSPHKIAKVSLCDKDGNPLNSAIVEAVMTDGDMTIESQYQSPFEASNPENRLPTLLGMAQSGEATAALGRIAENIGNAENASRAEKAAGRAARISREIAEATGSDALIREFGNAVKILEGRTNLTKVNSTQVYVSSSPIRISATLFFMAYRDAQKEVEDQIRLLQQWALPIYLSDIGLVESVAGQGLAGLFPSQVPPFVSLGYSGKTYKPLLIESVSTPIVAPIDTNGNRLTLSVSLTLVSRQAWDQNDINHLYGL
ncbi:MAG: hypothetical protein VXW65_12895 [Pseudomonadota bacterium]|nr:hypothetical protein [Pseudomonadota bacterium]